jgi:hypothetical protein
MVRDASWRAYACAASAAIGRSRSTTARWASKPSRGGEAGDLPDRISGNVRRPVVADQTALACILLELVATGFEVHDGRSRVLGSVAI